MKKSLLSIALATAGGVLTGGILWSMYYSRIHHPRVEFDGPAALMTGLVLFFCGLIGGTTASVLKFHKVKGLLIAFLVMFLTLILSSAIVGYAISDYFIGRYGYHERYLGD